MGFESITAIAGNTSAVALALLVVGWFWIYLKTGSSHPLSMRVWRLLTGSQLVSHPEIRAYIEEQDSLMAFRVSSGMHVRSTDHAKRAIDFVAERGICPDLMRQVGNYFDASELRMASTPSKWLMGWYVCSGTLLALLFAIAGYCSLDQRVLVTLTETGRWVWLSEKGAEAANPMRLGERPRLAFSACPTPDREGWSAREVEILCSLKSDPTLVPYLEKARAKQPLAFLMLAFTTLVIAISQGRGYLRATAAKRLAAQISATEDGGRDVRVASETSRP